MLPPFSLPDTAGTPPAAALLSHPCPRARHGLEASALRHVAAALLPANALPDTAHSSLAVRCCCSSCSRQWQQSCPAMLAIRAQQGVLDGSFAGAMRQPHEGLEAARAEEGMGVPQR